MTVDPQRVQALFLTALELSDATARRELLNRKCAGDEALLRRVAALLSAHDAAGGFGDEPSGSAFAATIQSSLNMRPGTHIAGRYKLIEAIGEGGMGTVWMAEQKEPVKRKVAIKLVKAGMDSRQVLARFEVERQALAIMDHPHIARVFDGGMTDEGRPFFVMEFVKGVPLTEYCDHAKLSLKERLNLFIPVCQAVQHAHQKGIIHRDLKPSNILICLYDSKPVPKVIDFGLAKAIHQSLTEQTLHTAIGTMVGTPLYMSPEQAEHNNLDIDTRSDIYSLGVILYELLTGTTPLERHQLKEAAYNEILRLIKEVEPPRPSTRLSGSTSLPSIAAQRSIEPKQLSKSLSGDLDWIVMKAIDKERGRRYETTNALAADVENYLSSQPVTACPPSTMYRFRKFAKRYRGLIASGSIVALSLVIGIVGTTWALLQAETAKAEALAAQDDAQLARNNEKQRADAEHQAHLQTQRERDRASEAEANTKAFARFLIENILAAPRPEGIQGGKGVDVTMVEALRQAEPDIADVFKSQWKAEAMTRHAIGVTWRQLGSYNDAEHQLRSAIELLEGKVDQSDSLLRECRNSLAVNLFQLKKYDESLILFKKLLKLCESEFGPTDSSSLRCRLHIGDVYFQQGNLTAAQQMYNQILHDMTEQSLEDNPDRLKTAGNLANVYMKQKNFQKAYDLYGSVILNMKGVQGRDLIACQQNKAIVCYILGKRDEGFELFRESSVSAMRLLGPAHADFRQLLHGMALYARKSSQHKKLDPAIDEMLRQGSDLYGPSSGKFLSLKEACAALSTKSNEE